MTIDELIHTIRTSTGENWHNLNSNGPFYKHRIVMNGNTPMFDQHLEFASFKNDLQITLGWGLLDNNDFQAPYANNNPDPNAKGMWLDVFFNGAMVFRTMYISVDGGRCNIPIPSSDVNGGWEVSNEYADLIHILNQIHGLDRNTYDRYLHDIRIVNKPWNY
jgi:hypothetical protein